LLVVAAPKVSPIKVRYDLEMFDTLLRKRTKRRNGVRFAATLTLRYHLRKVRVVKVEFDLCSETDQKWVMFVSDDYAHGGLPSHVQHRTEEIPPADNRAALHDERSQLPEVPQAGLELLQHRIVIDVPTLRWGQLLQRALYPLIH